MNVNKEQLLAQFKSVTKRNFDSKAEADHVLTLMRNGDIAKMLDKYEYCGFINAGGSGLVFEIKDKITRASRALKVARLKAPQEEFGPKNPVNVELEIQALALVGHQNITRFYDGLKIQTGHYIIVTQFVEGPKSLDEWVTDHLAVDTAAPKESSISEIPEDPAQLTARPPSPPKATSQRQITEQLIGLSEKLLGYAQALAYMHTKHRLYHMDIKPANLLIAGDGTPFVTDLGFARWREKYADDADVPVGFTFGLHHPELMRASGFGIPSTLAKAHNLLKGSQLSPKFDLYAFGRTMLALLRLFEKRYGDRVRSNYCFLYLHLLAALLLDGKNQEAPKHDDEMFSTEIALDFKGELLEAFKFTSFEEVVERLERLLGRRPIEHRIPELNPWYPRSVNHGTGFLNLTPRVQAIIQHPAFRRLRTVKQLGNIDEVYSGASHTRYAHSEGVVGMICTCLQALYNDPENPIFRVLVADSDVSEMIAAALLHDLGQSGFGHDLEELSAGFAHSEITNRIVKHSYYVDADKRTLKQILSGQGPDEWNVDPESVLQILTKDLILDRFQAFADLLNGPVDADKLDYLVRDGRMTGVRHGDALDVHRLLRCLTILPVDNPVYHKRQLRLGIKEKGLPTSEMVVLVRQKMYASVYLHHAAREVKAMVANACAGAVARLESEISDSLSLYRKTIIQTLYTAHLIGLDPDVSEFPEKDRKKIMKLWNERIKPLSIPSRDLDYSIQFFAPFLNEREALLIEDVKARRLYKRLWARSFASLGRERLDHLKDVMAWHNRGDTAKRIEQALIDAIRKRLENRTAIAESMNRIPDAANAFQSPRALVLLDMPFRGLGPGGDPPPVLSDISRKRGKYAVQGGAREGVGHIWGEGAAKMMDEACFCSIFAEPEFTDFIFSVIDQAAVDLAIAKILKT